MEVEALGEAGEAALLLPLTRLHKTLPAAGGANCTADVQCNGAALEDVSINRLS